MTLSYPHGCCLNRPNQLVRRIVTPSERMSVHHPPSGSLRVTHLTGANRL
jgi:hypothetical protein